MLQSDKLLPLIARRFKMLGEPYRLRLLQALEEGEKTAGETIIALDGKQPNVSKRMKMLHDARLASRTRDDTSIYYGIADPIVTNLCKLVCHSASERVREEYDELHAPVLLRPARGCNPRSGKEGST